jgi:hypothetical protein
MRPLTLSLALLATVLGAVPPVAAQTIIAGGNLLTQTWTPAGSPYIVQGDATISSTRTLTIQAGAVVTFASTDGLSSGSDMTKVELIINGTLRVNGTGDSPVLFRAQTGTARGTWHGIVLATTATATLNDFELRHAAYGLDSRASSPLVQRATFTENATAIRTNAGSLQVRNSVVSSNNQAIYSEGGTPLFDAITVFGNFDGVRLNLASAATIRNSVIRDQAGYGIYASPSSVTTTNVTHCTLHQNHDYNILWSVFPAGNGAQLLIRNSIVTGSQSGVNQAAGAVGSVSVTYSDVWNNIQNYTPNVSPGTGTVSLNPIYVAPPTDLHLSPTSFVLDVAEEIGVTSDRDGTPRPLDGDEDGTPQPDMGAYEVVPSSYDMIFQDGFE